MGGMPRPGRGPRACLGFPWVCLGLPYALCLGLPKRQCLGFALGSSRAAEGLPRVHWKASALSSAPPEGADRPGLASKYFTSRVVQPFDAYTQSPCVWWKSFVGTRNQPPGKDAEQNWPLFSRIGPSTTPAPQKNSLSSHSRPYSFNIFLLDFTLWWFSIH